MADHRTSDAQSRLDTINFTSRAATETDIKVQMGIPQVRKAAIMLN